MQNPHKESSTSFLLTLIFSLWTVTAMAQGPWHSIVSNFGRDDYGPGAQTWKVQGDTVLYFANQKDLIVFDQMRWSRLRIPNETVRSVLPAPDEGRLYVGGINEYGYFSPGANGEMVYTSVCQGEPDSTPLRYPGNIWNIHRHGSTTYYCTEQHVLRFTPQDTTILAPDGGIDASALIDGALFVANPKGLHVLVGSTFMSIPGSEAAGRYRIKGIMTQGRKLLVFTATGGAFLLDGFTAEPFRTAIDDYMRENETFCVTSGAGKIAVGTVRGGLAIIDANGKNPVYFSEANGLQDNTVLSLRFDPQGNLWAGLDRGIDRINLSLPFMALTEANQRIGLGYAAAIQESILYLGTNRGLYSLALDQKNAQIQEIKGVSGQVWDLCKIGQHLYCTSDHGIFLIQGNQAKRQTDLSAVWTIRPAQFAPNKLLAGTYTGLWVLDYANGMLRVDHKVDGFNDSMREFCEDGNSVWIISQASIDHLTLDNGFHRLEQRSTYPVPDTHNLSILTQEPTLTLLADNEVLKYDQVKDQFITDSLATDIIIGKVPYRHSAQGYGNLFLLSPTHLAIIAADGQQSKTVHQLNTSEICLVEDFENIFPISPTQAILPTEQGFILFEDKAETGKRPNTFAIRHLFSTTGQGSTLYARNPFQPTDNVELDAHFNSVLIETGADYGIEGIEYQYQIDQEDWSAPSPAPIKQFTHLSPGEHTIKARALYPDGSVNEDELTIKIATPWYRTWWAWLIYFALIDLAAWLVLRWDKRRTAMRERKAVAQKEKEMQMMEEQLEGEIVRQEQQIESLEREKLEEELKHKSLEMANMMVNMTQKNEMLNDIKREIAKVMGSIKGNEGRETRQQLGAITANIDASINSQEMIQRIEEQFDLLHNNFMKRLSEQYPSLSANERMMCAYLKMQLSTKEIAQLFNLSVRGVETVRYRLRKKLGLAREQSLTDFINSI